MQKTIALLLTGLLLVGAIGCGGGDKARPKPGDPATKNTVDPPDATKLPGNRSRR